MFLIAGGSLGAMQQATVLLATSANPSVLGQSVTLTTSVLPGGANGTFTFYDATTILGICGVSGGQATLITIVPASGVRLLRASYSGDTNFSAATSPVMAQTVTLVAGHGFVPANFLLRQQQTAAAPVVVADFNGDGIRDLAIGSIGRFSVLSGNGAGCFARLSWYLLKPKAAVWTRFSGR
ncbi:MAG TPA: Ig-like domain-containing protein [Bryobacteraceae bacterium]